MATPIECDIVDALSGDTLGTARFPLVPRVGDEIDLDLKGAGVAPVYQIVRVRYHMRPRRFTVRTDDVYGVALFVTPIE